ncbi:SEC10/PgrA surface exclusion domain-containing protein [Lactobacillus taiwanensis]|uniref:SEC10/PgrA surface exclusion domain-containing protein n=1 Tax=Lactobacillus taiwanensis TaxID=508451 RepID=UPI0025AFF5D9|nr:SEC10/PgrA surface exclusion domain-containing protein [Lactobacillus taiwanensis]
MKNKDKLMYVSAAVLAAGTVAGVKTTNVKAAEVKQVNANSKLDLNNAAQEEQAIVQDKTAQGQIKQDTATVQKTQDQLKQDQAAKTQAESAKTEAQNTLPVKETAVQTAQTKLDNAKQELTQTEAQNKDLHAQYDSTTENAVHTAQEAEKKLDQKVNDLTDQVQNAQNKQTDLLGQRTNVEGEIKTNTETLNNVNEQLNKAQADQAQAQKHFDNVQKDYVPIQNEYNAKKSATEKAAQDLKQNETDLAQSQKQLSDLQTKNDDLAKTVNSTQDQLDNANKEINDVKTDLNQSQAKLNDVQKQSNDVNGKLSQAIVKRDQAKSALDSQSTNSQTITLPKGFKETFLAYIKAMYADEKQADELEKQLAELSRTGKKMNEYQRNLKDEKRVVDVQNLTSDQLLELNKFGINLINQFRAQLGKKPVLLTQGSLKFATDVARIGSSHNNLESLSFHDMKALYEGAKLNGLSIVAVGENAGPHDYYGTEPKKHELGPDTMDTLKQGIYDDIVTMIFGNVDESEWQHADLFAGTGAGGDVLDYVNSDGEHIHKEYPVYFGIGVVANPPIPNKYNPNIMKRNMRFVYDRVIDRNYDMYDDPNTFVPEDQRVDYNKFNVKDVIPIDNLDNSQARQVYAAAQNEVNNLQSQKNSLDSQIESLTEHITQSQNKVNNFTKTINDLSTKLANAKTEQGSVQGQLSQTAKHVDELKAAQPALVQARDNTVNALADYEQTHATVLNDYNNAKSQLEQANNKLQSATKAKDEAEKVLSQNKAKLAKINQELDAVKSQLADLTAQLSDAKASQASAKANLEKAQADYDNYVNTHKDLIAQISDSDKEVTAKKEALAKAQSAYDKASQEYEEAKNEVAKLDNKVKDLDQSIATSQDSIKKLNNRITSNTQIIESNKQVYAQASKLAARKAFDAQINKALDKVVYAAKPVNQHTAQAATVKPAVSTKNTKHALPQTGANDKLSLFAALAGLSLSSIGLGSLVSDKKRKRN